MKRKMISISEELWRKLTKIKYELSIKLGKNISYDTVIRILLSAYEKSKAGCGDSDDEGRA